MERKGRGMNGYNEERGTGRDPEQPGREQSGRKEAEESGVREEKRRLPPESRKIRIYRGHGV